MKKYKYIAYLLCLPFIFSGCQTEIKDTHALQTNPLPTLKEKNNVKQVKGLERAIAHKAMPSSPFQHKKINTKKEATTKISPLKTTVKEKKLPKQKFPWRLAGIFSGNGKKSVLLMTETEKISLSLGEEKNNLLLLDITNEQALIRSGEKIYSLTLTLPVKQAKKVPQNRT